MSSGLTGRDDAGTGWTFELAQGRCLRVRRDRPTIFGILNVTPDSFSDGGLYSSCESAIARALEVIEQGADVIDIGGESTRPGSLPVSDAEQVRRVVPVIEGVRASSDGLISIDTSSPSVAAAAFAAGADIANDVNGFRHPGWESVLRMTTCPLIVMHMLRQPRDMQDDPSYPNGVTEAVRGFFEARLEDLSSWGVDLRRVILDPGIGFGKRLQHNLELIRNIEELRICQRPILVGLSRKRFIGTLLGHEVGQRDIGTVAANMVALFAGANMLRVHNVPYTKELVSIFAAIQCGSRTEDSDS